MMKKQTTPPENQTPQKRPLKKKGKKNIPIINISIQQGLSYDYLTDSEDFRGVIYIQSIEAIKLGIENNLKEIELCEIAHSLRYLVLHRDQWNQVLNSALSFFLEKEDYETCGDIQKMIEKI